MLHSRRVKKEACSSSNGTIANASAFPSNDSGVRFPLASHLHQHFPYLFEHLNNRVSDLPVPGIIIRPLLVPEDPTFALDVLLI